MRPAGTGRPMISRLLRHAQGQTFAEFWSPQATQVKTCILVWNSRHVQLISRQFNSLVNHIPFITNDHPRQIIENLIISLAMKGISLEKLIWIVAHVWNPKHLQLIPLLFNWLDNHIPFVTNDYLMQIIEKHLYIALVINGMWLISQLNCSGISCTCLGFQTCPTVLIGLPAICFSEPLILKEGILWFYLDNDCLL